MTQAELASLTTFANKADTAAGDIQKNLSNLLGQLQALYPKYQGLGGGAYQEVVGVVQDQMTVLHQALTYMSSDVATASQNYDAADQAQQQEMKKIHAQASNITHGLS